MKANQVYNFSTGFKFPQNFLLMNYKLNKTHNHTWKSNADLSRITSWGHKLYIKGAQVWDFDVFDFSDFFIMKSI